MKITYALIISFFVIFLIMGFLPEQTNENIYKNYSFSLNNLFEGKIWTFITSIFIHGGPSHLVLNCIALFFFGTALEENITTKKYLIIFFLGGIVGNLASGFLMPGSSTIGASGGIFAIMGTAMLISPFEFIIYPYLIPIPLALVGVLYTVYTIIEFLTVKNANIAYSAHIGGLIIGILFGIREEDSLKGFLVVILLFILILFIPTIWRVFDMTNYVRIIQNVIGI
ncbi:MAG: rhomboid family intramembrane serine protease [Candidatus Aenigmatarchaeota archaeon]